MASVFFFFHKKRGKKFLGWWKRALFSVCKQRTEPFHPAKCNRYRLRSSQGEDGCTEGRRNFGV